MRQSDTVVCNSVCGVSSELHEGKLQCLVHVGAKWKYYIGINRPSRKKTVISMCSKLFYSKYVFKIILTVRLEVVVAAVSHRTMRKGYLAFSHHQ